MKKTLKWKTWNNLQWRLAEWAIWREMMKNSGKNDSDVIKYGADKMLKWYFDFDLWDKEFPKKKRQDIRGFIKFRLKNETG